MAGLGDLVLKFFVDDSRLKRGLKDAEGEARKTGKAIGDGVDRGARKAGDSVDKLGDKTKKARREADGLSSSWSAFRGAAILGGVTALAGGVALLGGAAIKAAGQAQQFEVSLSTMYGSAIKGKAALKDLTDFAATTPFEIPEIRKAGTSLAAFGVAQDKLIPTLKNLGNVASGVNAPIGEIAEIFGKAKVQGRLFMEDINQFGGRGIPVLDQLAKNLKKTPEDVRKMVSEGKIGFKELEAVFVAFNAQGGKFGGLMEAQSKTLNGRLSALNDSFTKMAEKTGLALSPILLPAIEKLTLALDGVGPAVEGMVGGFMKLPEVAKIAIGVGLAVGTITAAVLTLAAVGTALTPVFVAMGASTTAAFAGILIPAAGVTLAITGLILLLKNWEGASKSLKDNFGIDIKAMEASVDQFTEVADFEFQKFIVNTRNNNANLWRQVGKDWKKADRDFANFINNSQTNNQVFWEQVRADIKTGDKAFSGFIDNTRKNNADMWAAVGRDWKAMGDGWNTLMGNLKTIGGGALDWIKGKWNDLGQAADKVKTVVVDFVKAIAGLADNPLVKAGLAAGSAVLNSAGQAVEATKEKAMGLFGDSGEGVMMGGGQGNLGSARATAAQMGLQMTSHKRSGPPGASYHNVGRAMDFSDGRSPTPGMMRFAKHMVANYGNSLAELIYTPLGFSIKHGKKVPPIAAGTHNNHVHVAFNKGGIVPGSGNTDTVPAMLTPGEFVLTKEQTKKMQFLNKGGQVMGASWYGPGFHGKPTASGEKFNQNDMTAAHKTLPFGTSLRVTNPKTGKSVTVRINDRGPFKAGRDIDLSKAAAQAIGLSGVGKVLINGGGTSGGSGGDSSSSSSETPAEKAKKAREVLEEKRTAGMQTWKENRDKQEAKGRNKFDQNTKEGRANRDSALEIRGINAESEAAKRLIALKQEENKVNDELADKLLVIKRKRDDLKAEQAYKIKNKVKGGVDYAEALKLLDEEEKHERAMTGTARKTEVAKRNAEIAKVNAEIAASYEGLSEKAKDATMALVDGDTGAHLVALKAINNENKIALADIDKEMRARQEILAIDPKNVAAAEQLAGLSQTRAEWETITAEKLADQNRAYEAANRATVASQIAMGRANEVDRMTLKQQQAEAQGDTFGAGKIANDIELFNLETAHNERIRDLTAQIEESQRKIAEYRAKGLESSAVLEEGNLNTLLQTKETEEALNPQRIELVKNKYKDLGQTIREEFLGNLKNGLAGLIQGTTSFMETIGNLLSSLADRFLQLGLDTLFQPGAFGGKGIGAILGNIFKFSNGGVVPGVGNRDTVPALLTPGEVVLNKAQVRGMRASNGGASVGSVNINMGDSGGSPQQNARFGKVLTAKIKEAIIDEQRQGGSLYKAGRR